MPPNKYCWDAGVFIAILIGEQRSPEQTAGLFEVMDAADRGSAIVITSTMALGEVIGGRGTPNVRNAFEALFRRPTFVMHSPSPSIFETVADIRDAAREEGRNLKLPDATYIATAMATSCDALHTFDDKLIAVSGRDYVGGLRICNPSGDQTVLTLV